jgi:hypothetical protein
MGPAAAAPPLGKAMYAGLFLVTMAVLMYEILLTRIFSVTMYYHFAFVAISVAMFGLAAGSVVVYIFPAYFSRERAQYLLALTALALAISIPVSFLMHLTIPFFIHRSLVGVFSVVLNYCILSVPFVISGICVSIALTKFPGQISRFYAADLVGGACGCLLLIATLKVTDGPTNVIIAAALISLGAILFLVGTDFHRLRRLAITLFLALMAFTVVNSLLVHQQLGILKPIWVKGALEERPLFEKWNSFSRIIVFGDPDEPIGPIGWNISETYQSDKTVRQLRLNIDADAATVLTNFDGNLADHSYLKYDLTNIAHYLRPQADVCVIGVGGGRDVLSALAFDQKSVVGIEINEDIIATVNQRYGAFTGHLDQDPRVTFIHDEARSYLTRQHKKFDLIQSSFIDSWAATAAGAFVLTENALYTVDAWKIFLGNLKPGGILTFTRWYNEEAPDEVYRLTSLARTALLALGIQEPRGHIMIIRKDQGASLLVSTTPFTPQDVATIDQVSQAMNFQVLLSPTVSSNPILTTIASGQDLTDFYARFPADIEATTDNNPFFFNTVRLRDMFDPGQGDRTQNNVNTIAYFLLAILLATVMALSYLCIVVPLRSKTKAPLPRQGWPLVLFFAAIGLGFMFIELGLMQRLIVFLGHPTYALSVVLFTLLLSSGIGSFLTHAIAIPSRKRLDLWCHVVLAGTLILFAAWAPFLTVSFRAAPTPTRILTAVGILFPLGLLMGMAFPLGIKRATTAMPQFVPWLCGLNGAMSICASVLAMIISLGFGIAATLWTGVACYAVAAASYCWVATQADTRAGAGMQARP